LKSRYSIICLCQAKAACLVANRTCRFFYSTFAGKENKEYKEFKEYKEYKTTDLLMGVDVKLGEQLFKEFKRSAQLQKIVARSAFFSYFCSQILKTSLMFNKEREENEKTNK
jgi:hypothetical protein